jgi:2-methylcitrate dehydratase
MVAIGLIHGHLTAEQYEDQAAADTRVDRLRARMDVVEDERYSRDYHDPGKRSIANAIQVFFNDGGHTDKIEIEYPIGHRRRRSDGMPLLIEKFRASLDARFPEAQSKRILDLCLNHDQLVATPVPEFIEMFVA